MDISLRAHQSYHNKPVAILPKPALVLSRPVLEQNIQRLLDDVSEIGIAFRPHVKTLKSIEVTRMMLGGGKHRSIVASTVCEIEGVLPLVEEGILDECLYGLPIAESVLPRLATLARSVKVLLMIDNEQQIQLLERFSSNCPEVNPWKAFIKIDVGSHRAGLMSDSPSLSHLIERTESSPAVSIYGFYCHAGHSYGCRNRESVQGVLQMELDGVMSAAKKLPAGDRPIVLSIGSTPTAHSIQYIEDKLPAGSILELIAGNFPANDLQQVCTGVVNRTQQAVRILTEVCSFYPERNEALVNAGTIAFSRETSADPGFGQVVDKPGWHVVRLSQEHGILGFLGANETRKQEKVEDWFRVGQNVFLYCQHACITAAAFHVYYVVDENDIVRDTWVPWKGW